MTLREELVAMVRELPEENLPWIAPYIRRAAGMEPQVSMAEGLRQADEYYAQIKEEVGQMPDVVEMIHDMREARDRDIMGLR